jgi:hypothetical protein
VANAIQAQLAELDAKVAGMISKKPCPFVDFALSIF